MQDSELDQYQLGVVKKFGGNNKRTNRENKFGFIRAINGKDIFVHANEIINKSALENGELVIFQIGNDKGRGCAIKLSSIMADPKLTIRGYELFLKNKDKCADSLYLDDIKKSLNSIIGKNQNQNDSDFISQMKLEANKDFTVFRMIRGVGNWSSLFSLIVDIEGFKRLINKGLPLELVPDDYKKSNERLLYACIEGLEAKKKYHMYINNITTLPINIILAGVLNQSIASKEIISARLKEIQTAIGDIFKGTTTTLPDYVTDSLKYRGDLTIRDLLEKNIHLNLIPSKLINEQGNELFDYIHDLGNAKRKSYFIENINILPSTIILACVVESLLVDEALILSRYTDLSKVVESRFRCENTALPEYILNAFKDKSKYRKNPIIMKILEPLQLKKHLYNKKYNVNEFFNHSTYLKSKIEYFILVNLFLLVQVNNNLDVIYKVFLHRLWESLSTESININDKGFFNLFPSCSTMSKYQLSCEAVFWPKTEKYLCRGQVCNDSKIKPDITKHYLDFNIYDWFQHYGINYINESTPSKRDFPIKLAGYFNRLKEIFNVLHCRECGNLMKPDMRYARVEFIGYESGVPVKKSMAAAYRATVFECGALDCQEYKKKYYINHCLGFGCDNIIDSRNLNIKCDYGLYICKGCGGCCEEHAKQNSIGSCPNCGSKLNLFEDERQANSYGNNKRYVQCSNQRCNFNITENLPKKFYLPSCFPVKKN